MARVALVRSYKRSRVVYKGPYNVGLLFVNQLGLIGKIFLALVSHYILDFLCTRYIDKVYDCSKSSARHCHTGGRGPPSRFADMVEGGQTVDLQSKDSKIHQKLAKSKGYRL